MFSVCVIKTKSPHIEDACNADCEGSNTTDHCPTKLLIIAMFLAAITSQTEKIIRVTLDETKALTN